MAGFQYYAGPNLWDRLRVGQPLDLAREHDNPYDRHAVRVDCNGEKLDYVPRIDNAAISQLMDRGQPVTARIAKLTASTDPWKRVELEVRLLPDFRGIN